jgi:hypothetical protein
VQPDPEQEPEAAAEAAAAAAARLAAAEAEAEAAAAAAAAAAELEGDVLQINITADGCNLAAPLPPCLVGRCEDLMGTEQPAENLLEALRSRGLNLMPRDHDMAAALKEEEWHPPLMSRAMAIPKVKCLEDRVYRDVSRVCSSFAIHSCRYEVKTGSLLDFQCNQVPHCFATKLTLA